MAYISNVPARKSAAAATGLRGAYDRFMQRLADSRMFARTLRELESLSDRELADLGLSRGSLRDIARQAVYTD